MDKKKLKSLAISENGFIFDPETGYSYNVNSTGLFILRQMQMGHSKAKILEQLCAEHEVNEDQAESDYMHFLTMLSALEVLES